jgi:cation diffusion facilitator CzcD-associated flavoprotein CzcO
MKREENLTYKTKHAYIEYKYFEFINIYDQLTLFVPFQRYHFEFVVVCTGKYGDIPLMPTFPRNKGPEVFNGKVLHTIDYCKLDKEATSDLVKGKKTVVVGYKKSAIDLAMECAQANQGNNLL